MEVIKLMLIHVKKRELLKKYLPETLHANLRS